jgi:hypothetical protein
MLSRAKMPPQANWHGHQLRESRLIARAFFFTEVPFSFRKFAMAPRPWFPRSPDRMRGAEAR